MKRKRFTGLKAVSGIALVSLLAISPVANVRADEDNGTKVTEVRVENYSFKCSIEGLETNLNHGDYLYIGESVLVDLSEYAEKEHQRQLNEQLEAMGLDRTRALPILQNSGLHWSLNYHTAGGQNPCGFNHGPSGGSISWSGTGGGSVSVSLGVSWAGFGGSVSVAAGRSGVTGHNINIPAFAVNRQNLLQIRHQVSVRTYRINNANGSFALITTSAVNQQRARIVVPGNC